MSSKEISAETAAQQIDAADVTRSTPTCSNTIVISRFFYLDPNCRVYEMDGVKKNSPFHLGYFRPITITGENDKEFICDYGIINKKSKTYKWGKTKYRVYTEQEMLDDVYVQENRHLICERVRKSNAFVLNEIEALLAQNGL